MNMPIELQMLIKEYAMPIYKRTLHYKAICIFFLPVLKCKLRSTPYTLLKQKLVNTYYIIDLIRGGIINHYHSFTFTIMYDISLTDVILLE